MEPHDYRFQGHYDWDQSLNWQPNGIPGASDTATFLGARYSAWSAGYSIGDLELSAGIIQEQGTLTVYGGTMSGGQISLSSYQGVLEIAAASEFDTTGGTISGQGNTAPGTPKPLQGSNALIKVDAGKVWKVKSPTIAVNVQNNGTINFASASPLFDQGAVITNSGMINISSSNIDVTLNNVSSSITNNANIFTSGGASTCGMPITNSGASALLSVDSDFSVVGNAGAAVTQSGASAATLIYAGYELTCTGGYSQSAGTLQTKNAGTSQVGTLGGNVTITGGSVQPAALPANSYGELNITADAGSGTFTMTGGTLIVAINVPIGGMPAETTNYSWVHCAGAASVTGSSNTLSVTTAGAANIVKNKTTWHVIKSDTSFTTKFALYNWNGGYTWTEVPAAKEDDLNATNAPQPTARLSAVGFVATQAAPRLDTVAALADKEAIRGHMQTLPPLQSCWWAAANPALCDEAVLADLAFASDGSLLSGPPRYFALLHVGQTDRMWPD